MRTQKTIANLVLAAVLAATVSLGGCGQDGARSAPTQQQGVSEVMQEQVQGDGTHAYPQDYPADETEVVVTGVFDTYDENGTSYVHLVDASMEAA